MLELEILWVKCGDTIVDNKRNIVGYNNFNIFISTIIIIFLYACTSKIERQTSIKTTNEDIPKWFLEEETALGFTYRYIYSNGVGESSDLQMSLDIALLNAKLGLADKLQNNLSGITKSFTNHSKKEMVTEIEKTIQNLVTNANVSGYRIVNKEIKKSKDNYKSFIRIEYDLEKKKMILSKQTLKSIDIIFE